MDPTQNGGAEPAPTIHPSRLAALGLAPPPAMMNASAPPAPAPSGSSSRPRSRSRDRKSERRDRDRDRDRKDRDRDRDRDRRDSKSDRKRSRSRSRDRRKRSRSRDRSEKSSSKPSRREPSKFWDVPAPGYENVTPMQFKIMLAAGQVPAQNMVSMIPGIGPQLPPPGERVKVDHDPAALSGMAVQPQAMISNQLTRQARRLYIGSIPLGATDPDMLNFFNETMIAANLNTQPGMPVLSAQVNLEKNFAFLEVRSIDECTNCLALDGITYRGTVLKIRRPKDYMPLPGQNPDPPLNVYIPGVISTTVPDNEHKMFIGGLPTYFNEDQVKELLQAFGPLRAFNLVKDTATGLSKGFAFFQYVDVTNNDKCIAGLHGMQVGDKQLIVQRSSVNASGANLFAGGILPAMNMQQEVAVTNILVLLNMVTLEDLADDEEYSDILEDIKDECGKFGKVVSIQIPRPGAMGDQTPGLGKVFVEYGSTLDAKNGQEHLSGRKFGGQTVITSFLEPERYAAGILD